MDQFTFFITITFVLSLAWCLGNEKGKVASVYDIAEALQSFLNVDRNDNSNASRLPELRDKLARVESYVIDRDKYSELLIEQTKFNNLTDTNFYKALQLPDNFLMKNDTKNLFVKMKERMNRDDLLEILAKRGKKKMKVSARRMMNDNHVLKSSSDRELDDIVDKYLSESPVDEHKFHENVSQVVFDPKIELEERQAFHQPDGRRLFKGERTTVRYYPFMVSIHIMGRFWCGGALYASDLVITSASCLQLLHNNRFFRENPRALEVRIGSNHSRIGGELVDAMEVYFYPAYNPRTLNNNIAVIRLMRTIKLTYHRVPVVIPLYKQPYGMAFTAEVLLLGWGVTKTSQKLEYEPIFLQRKMLPVYPNMFCKEVYGDRFISNTMFCAGTMSTGEGACDHDAGGPAILDGYLAGIISFGPTVCGFPDAPTVFTMIGAYVDWIETIEANMADHYRARKRTTTSTPDPFVEYFATSTISPLNSAPLITVAPSTTLAPDTKEEKPAVDIVENKEEQTDKSILRARVELMSEPPIALKPIETPEPTPRIAFDSSDSGDTF